MLVAKDLAGMIPLKADAASYASVQKSLHTRSAHNRNVLPKYLFIPELHTLSSLKTIFVFVAGHLVYHIDVSTKCYNDIDF